MVCINYVDQSMIRARHNELLLWVGIMFYSYMIVCVNKMNCRQCSYRSFPKHVSTIIHTIIIWTGCPTILRCDLGTENSLLATAQTSFRMSHDDTLAAEKSIIYGASTHNTVCYAIGIMYCCNSIRVTIEN